MRSLFTRPFEALGLYLRKISTTNVLSILWVMMSIWLFRITNVQRPGIIAMSPVSGVLHTVIVLKTSSPASIKAHVDCRVMGDGAGESGP